MKFIANTILKGLLLILPLVVTFGLLYWLLLSAEQIFRIPINYILPAGWYIPGMGVLFALAVIFAFGIFAQAFLIKHLFEALEGLVGKIPFVKGLYSSARDLLNFAVSGSDSEMQKVVAVTLDRDIKLIGFVTNEDVSLAGEADQVAVYLPLSYQIGGFLLYIPRSRLEFLDIPVQQAMQQVLTAHIKRDGPLGGAQAGTSDPNKNSRN
jgi:uncharacterized membrane protein